MRIEPVRGWARRQDHDSFSGMYQRCNTRPKAFPRTFYILARRRFAVGTELGGGHDSARIFTEKVELPCRPDYNGSNIPGVRCSIPILVELWASKACLRAIEIRKWRTAT